jgi:hypothetical protein
MSVSTVKNGLKLGKGEQNNSGSLPKPQKTQELKFDLQKFREIMKNYPEKEKLGQRLGLPYGLPLDTFSELDSPLTVHINTDLGNRLITLNNQKNKTGLLGRVNSIVNEAVDIAGKSASILMHIPGMASEALGNKVGDAYEQAGQKLGGRIEPITNTLANVSRVIGKTVHNFSDNISSMVGEIMFHNNKDE